MKTVLFVIDAFQVGGATAFMEQHAREAARLGNTIVIIGAKGNIDNPQDTFSYATVVELSVDEGYGTFLGRWRWFVHTRKAIYAAYRSFSIQLFYAPLVCSYTVGLLHPRTWFIPRVYAFCGDVALEVKSARMEPETLRFRFKNWVRYVLQHVVIATSSTVITFSKYAESLLCTRYSLARKSKIVIIPGHVVPVTYRGKYSKQLSILTVGRFEPRKGLDHLLLAASILNQKKIDFHLTIAGAYEPVYLNYFFQLYEKLNLFTRVSFVHKVSSDQLAQLLSRANLCIVPSKDLETFGMMTITALAHGVPVIGTPTGATPEILSPIDKRLITRTIEPKEIARSILWFRSLSQIERHKLSDKITQSVRKQYDKNYIIKNIRQVFVNALQNSHE